MRPGTLGEITVGLTGVPNKHTLCQTHKRAVIQLVLTLFIIGMLLPFVIVLLMLCSLLLVY